MTPAKHFWGLFSRGLAKYQFQVPTFSFSEDREGFQNSKIGHLNQATVPVIDYTYTALRVVPNRLCVTYERAA